MLPRGLKANRKRSWKKQTTILFTRLPVDTLKALARNHVAQRNSSPKLCLLEHVFPHLAGLYQQEFGDFIGVHLNAMPLVI